VFRNPAPIRRRIGRPDCPDDFPVLAELRSAGMTDYLIQPLVSTDGAVSAVSWATARNGGFGDDDVADLGAICRPLTRLVEIHSLRRTAENLLDTYVGHATGARILGGRIRRGDTEVIRAAILLADLRGFTSLVNERPGDEVIGILNRFFDGLVPAIQRRGGEVLKFMGDGILAIFASGDGATAPQASCQAALQAVEEAHREIAVQNEALAGAQHGRLRFGAGLHFGEVVYGNIGAAGRLDFTAIGASVNLAARLQRLARDLDRDFVASADFAARCGTGLVALGRHRLAGFPEPQEAFGAPDGAA
jgi:adenylate cyclase